MSKPRTLFSYFSPKSVVRGDSGEDKEKSEVLTPKRSPNDKSPKSKNIKTPSVSKESSETPGASAVKGTPKTKSKDGKDSKSKQAKLNLVENGCANKELTLGDLVWAHLEGYPWWPGLITNHPTTSSYRMKGKVPKLHVQFFDDPPSRAWVKENVVRRYKGSSVDACKEGGKYWTNDEEYKEGITEACTQADAALEMSNEKRLSELHQHLPSTDEEDSEEDMDMDDIDSKENVKIISPRKTPSKSPRAKGRLPSRQAAKRRRIIIEAGNHDDSEDEFKPPKSDAEGSDDSASSGVDEKESNSDSDSEEYSDIAESPEKEGGKRKRGSSSSNPNPRAKKVFKNMRTGPKIQRIDSSDEEVTEEKATPVRQSPWSKPEPAKDKGTPSVSDKTKSRLTGFAAPEVSATPEPDAGRIFPHVSLEFLQPENIMDGQKRKKDHPEYNCRTLYIPQDFLNKQTPGMRQWWELKAKHYDSVLFFKMGKFYELFHMDAGTAVKELGLIYMKGDHAHSGFPEIAYARYADTLIQKGYRVARIEQTETPDSMQERCKRMLKPTKFDKVVRREVCRVSTKGTRTFSFIDGDTSDAKNAFLLAIAEKEPNEGSGKGSVYGVCFVDTSIGEFHIGQFEDDRHCSRLRTLISHFTPAQVLVERNRFSENTKNLLNNNLSSALRDTLRSGTEFWESSKTLKVLSENEYFIDENNKDAGVQWPDVLQAMKADSDPLGQTAKEENDLAMRSLGAVIWYLTDCCLDHEILSMRKFKLYTPLDKKSQLSEEEKKPASMFNQNKRMILDGVTLVNLDILENSSTGGPEGTLLERLNTCSTPFGKRLLKQWLCSPLCNPDAINDRLNAMADLIEAREVVAESLDAMKKLPDLERLLSKIHTLGSATRAKNHPDGRAVFFEDLTYSKRKIEDLLSALGGFTSAKEIIDSFKKPSKNFKSNLLRKTTSVEGEGHFPDLKEQLAFFETAFNQQKAKTQGTITPNKGVDPDYDQALEDMKKTKKQLDEYLEEQRDLLKCRTIAYWGTAKNRFQLEVPDQALKRVPDSYEVTSQKKGYRRYWTDEIKEMLADMLDAEERRDAALRDCLRKIFFSFDQSHSKWLAAVECIAVLDVLIALSEFSRCGDGVMCRPEILPPNDDTQPMMEIREGRHPCVARTFVGGDFIPNDTVVGIRDEQIDEADSVNADSKVVLVTGPNMGGKSTLMSGERKGCYVPAEVCRLTPVDRVFTRLGASDRIMAGESTFFVELSETSSILQHATRHSLVLLDELGRGTATYDGTAIACAVVQELSQNIGCRTLFSTHYHSLVEEFSHDPNVRLGHMACMVENENDEDPGQETITFLYKFAGGACPKSYGFNAARLADIPDDIIRVAIKKAKEFEIATNKSEWFRELCRADESKLDRVKAIQAAVQVS